jgi:tRNA (guanosine-2'-O-)-methyltransferase
VRDRCGRILATLPGEGSHSLYEIDMTQPTALLFGNEDEGIAAESLALCDGFFTIPQAGFAESLNISVACAVTLYEAYRQRLAKGYYNEHPQLEPAQQEQLFERWKKILKNEIPRNRGQMVGKDSAPLPPIFVERAGDTPPVP